MSFRKVDRPTPKKSVAAPLNPLLIQGDVERKIKIYGAVQALRQGHLPNNKQLDDALAFIQDTIPDNVVVAPSGSESQTKGGERALSDESQAVILGFRNIVVTTRQLLKLRNSDEVFQDLVHDLFNVQITSAPSSAEFPFSIDEARKTGESAVDHLRTILRLVMTNREARKILKDSKLILRDLFAQTAVAAAERARPSAEELRGLDDAAPAQDWAGDTEDMEEDDVFMDAMSELDDENEHGREGRYPSDPEQYEKGKQLTPPRTSKEEGTNDLATKLSTKKGSNINLKGRLRHLTGRVPEKHRARVEQEYHVAKAYLNEEFPPDRRDQFVWRLKKVISESQATEEYQASISWFLTMVRSYFVKTRTVATSHASQTNDLFSGDPHLARTLSRLRTVAERGAGGRSLDTLLEAIDSLWKDAREDADMKKWWDNVEGFLRKALLKPGYLTSPEFTLHARKLRASGRYFFTKKHKSHTDSLVQAAQTWSRIWMEDPLHVRFFDNWRRLIEDLMFDDRGRLTFKSDLWKDMRTIIFPGFMRKVGVIPIPRVEYADENLELVIENLALQGENIFPKTIEIIAKHYSKLETASSGEDVHRNSLKLIFSGIQANMHDVAFQYRKKLRFGNLKDAGLANIFIGGRGITIKIKVVAVSGPAIANDSRSLFEVEDVRVNVEELKFSIEESKHDLLYKTLRPIATRLIKKQISKAFSDGIHTALKYADGLWAAARDTMVDAAVKKDFDRDAFRDFLQKIPLETPVKDRQKRTFRVVSRRQSMLLSEMGHSRGWLRRQAEMDHAATQGDGWRSEAFNLATRTTPPS